MDEMVLKAQRWVNATYRDVPGYSPCTESGRTGWETMFSLTRALQHELGIVELSDNFGPTTWSLLKAYGNVGVHSSNINMRTIAEAALYCKGYRGGGINGDFAEDTLSGLTSLAKNVGLHVETYVTDVTPKLFKALLTMDAYVLLEGGDSIEQQVQRWLNGTYGDREAFFYGPCDGFFSRGVQQALVLAIQYQLGMGDDVVTGEAGPRTRAGLQAQGFVTVGSRDSGASGFVRLFKAAMHFNGWDGHWDNADGTFTDKVAYAVRHFQEFARLRITGDGDYQTWLELLLSTGDPERKGSAFDCMYPLNSTTIQVVKSAGYTTVGRYLTGGTNKRLTPSEVALINDNGMSFFPLYQEWGNTVEDFSYAQGYDAGRAACAAARSLGIPYGTVIYFSVDFDAIDSDIAGAVIPHFRGIQDAVRNDGNQYAVGVYGGRNTCRRLAAEGLSTRSFVSGMSWGYSGNLGFPLPENWAFNQISNLTLAPGSPGQVEIDNDIASGRDPGVSSVTRPRDPNDTFYTYLTWIEARAEEWRQQHPQHSQHSQADLVGQYLRMKAKRFDLPFGDRVFGELDGGFINHVESQTPRPDAGSLRDPVKFWDVDVDHFGASLGAVITHGLLADKRRVGLADFGSWGGDLFSTLGQFSKTGLPASKAYDWAHDHIASMADNGFFLLSDYFSDIDAMVFGLKCRADPSLRLSALIQQYYSDPSQARRRYFEFYQDRFDANDETMTTAATAMMGASDNLELQAVKAVFWQRQFASISYPFFGSVPDDVVAAVAVAFGVNVLNFALHS